MGIQPPAPNPCGSCPYRRDVPSGIWAREEYLKLPAYDLETGNQPAKVFMCHQQTGRVCAGWCGTHDMENNLAIRLCAGMRDATAETIRAIVDYRTGTPLFGSGLEACRHGLKGIRRPFQKAKRVIGDLIQKRRAKKEAV